jgi:hypothetical protein
MSLAEELESDLNWREAELAIFKRIVSSADEGSVRERALLRAMLALLYAHYEGFSKYAWELYLEAIESEAPIRGDLKPPLACLSLEEQFAKLRGDTSAASLLEFYSEKLPGLLNEPAEFPSPLQADSNLWPDRYCDNMDRACLKQNEMNDRRSKIKSLVARRNDIAHGESAFIKSLAEYQEYEDAAILVMHELAVLIIEALEEKNYLKRASN